MLTQFLYLVAYNALERISMYKYPTFRFWGLKEECFGSYRLHFDTNTDRIDGEGSFIVDAQAAGEGLPELN